jgi:hypothetical protein
MNFHSALIDVVTVSPITNPILCSNNQICLNDGVCYIISNTVICICPDGFTGEFCETQLISGCSPNPCLNSGTCVNHSNGSFFGCFCATGYIGLHCENTQQTITTTTMTTTSVPQCEPNLCLNGGTCVTNEDGQFFGCFCKNGYNGVYCDKLLNTTLDCQLDICMNGGTCVSHSNGSFFGCFCLKGYSGIYCQINQSDITVMAMQPFDSTACSSNTCMNSGTCIALDNDELYGCFCVSGYIGRNCETSTFSPSCSPNPCMNGGTCVSLTSGIYYGCMCTRGYIGNYCQILRKKRKLKNKKRILID